MHSSGAKVKHRVFYLITFKFFYVKRPPQIGPLRDLIVKIL